MVYKLLRAAPWGSSRALAVALAISLGACTLEPHYDRPPPPVPPVRGGAQGQGAQAAADIGWREFFPDPQLQELIALALTNNRDLRVAVLNVETAQQRYRVQRAELFPTIAATGTEQVQRFPNGVLSPTTSGGTATGGSRTPVPGSGTTTRFFDVGIGFTSYELDLFGRIRSLDHASLELYFNSIETRRNVQLTLVAEVASAYLTVLSDQTLLDITRDTLKSQSESYALTQRQFSAGTTTELALNQAETTVDTAEANLALYTRQIAQDRDALQLLLGAPIPADIDFSHGLDRPPAVAELEEGIPSDVLIRRPDVLAAEHQLQSANADIGAARAAFFPSITLTGSYGTASSKLSGLFKGGSEAWTFSPTINVPIFTGGANIANLRVSKLTRDTAIAQYEKAIQTAFQEVADALVARGTLDDQLVAQQKLQTASEKAYRLADMRYRGGVDSYLSALVAQQSLYSAQQQLTGVRLSRLQNLVTLYKVLGGGLLERTSTGAAVTSPAGSAHAAPAASN